MNSKRKFVKSVRPPMGIWTSGAPVVKATDGPAAGVTPDTGPIGVSAPVTQLTRSSPDVNVTVGEVDWTLLGDWYRVGSSCTCICPVHDLGGRATVSKNTK